MSPSAALTAAAAGWVGDPRRGIPGASSVILEGEKRLYFLLIGRRKIGGLEEQNRAHGLSSEDAEQRDEAADHDDSISCLHLLNRHLQQCFFQELLGSRPSHADSLRTY